MVIFTSNYRKVLYRRSPDWPISKEDLARLQYQQPLSRLVAGTRYLRIALERKMGYCIQRAYV